MKSLTTSTLQLFFLGTLIALALGMNYLAAWTGPTAAAPSGNATPPVNIGTTAQVKDGNLSVGRSSNTAADFGLISYGKIRSTVGGVEFPDGTVQTTAANSAPQVITARYGSGRRCASDAWVAACGYYPGQAWNYNMCNSRGHATSYGWSVVWVPAENGYRSSADVNQKLDLICDV